MFSDYIVLSLDNSLIKDFFADIENLGKIANNISKLIGLIK